MMSIIFFIVLTFKSRYGLYSAVEEVSYGSSERICGAVLVVPG